MDKPRKVHITSAVITKLLNNRAFIRDFPEFNAIRAVALRPPKRGCTKCNKRKQGLQAVFAFLQTLRSLSPPKLTKFKGYVNADEITFNVRKREERRMKMVTITL
jgi:hypothetical protein